MIQRLRDIEPHAAFFLLKNFLWVPKLLYLLRSSPVFKDAPDALKRIDNLLCEGLSSTINVEFNCTNWNQDVLPVSTGGLGFRRTADLALPAYLSSTHSTAALIKDILPPNFHCNLECRIMGP